MCQWHAEHVRFAQVLNLLEMQITALRAGGTPDYVLMRDLVSGPQNFANCCHHPREDVAFERLARCKPDIRIVFNRLLQEHRVLAWAGDELLGRLAEIIEDVTVERAALKAAVSTYIAYCRHYLAREERDILPLAAQLLTPDDRAAVASAVAPDSDSLFGPDFDARYEQLRRQIASN